jgi:ribosomal protein S27AE/type IV secretory pathway TrbD component
MALLKLSCVNCSAPLEIGADLERFACGYCGTNQVVERSGGTVALRRVADAIQAVQRGTDKTAAELAVPRLQRELAEARKERAEALKAAEEKRARQLGGRRGLTFLVGLVIFFVGLILVTWLSSSESIGSAIFLITWAWMISLVAIPTFVFFKVKLPPDERATALAPFDATIARIEQRIQENKAILDA